MTRSLFVVGTDTGVGKTLVACGLVTRLRAQGLRVVGVKPVAAGTVAGAGTRQNEDVVALASASTPGFDPAQVNPYLFDEAVAPHLAAARLGLTIGLDHIVNCCTRLAAAADAVVVEGVGGFRVPLGDDFDSADLAVRLSLPVVLVVGIRLGCINHALLTAEAIAARGLRLAGWVANQIDVQMPLFHENVGAIKRRVNAPLLGTLPWLGKIDNDEIAAYLSLPQH